MDIQTKAYEGLVTGIVVNVLCVVAIVATYSYRWGAGIDLLAFALNAALVAKTKSSTVRIISLLIVVLSLALGVAAFFGSVGRSLNNIG